jgi:cell division protein FtsZ
MGSKLTVIGVGGSGIQAVRVLDNDVQYKDIDFLYVVDSDREDVTFLLSEGQLYELNADTMGVFREKLVDTDILFLVAALGNESIPSVLVSINQIAREMGVVTIALASKPFGFESETKKKIAEHSVQSLIDLLDCLFVIPIEHIGYINQADKATVYKIYDETMSACARALLDPIIIPALVNLDAFDLKMLCHGAGIAFMGFGRSLGEGGAIAAVSAAAYSPFIERPLGEANGILCSVLGGDWLEFDEIEEIMNYLRSETDPRTTIKFTVSQIAEMNDELRVTISAIGFKPREDMALYLPGMGSQATMIG